MFKKGLLNRFVSTQESQLDKEGPETSETDEAIQVWSLEKTKTNG